MDGSPRSDPVDMESVGGIWRIWHKAVTGSTNVDALGGRPGDVFTADRQMSGRGRLNHRWLSPPGENLMMSAVIGVDGMPPEEVPTLPIVVGLAVARSVAERLAVPLTREMACGQDAGRCDRVKIKWPNDVLVDGRKVCGILCERNGDCVIAGMGINVNQTVFAPEIADRATSLRLELARCGGGCDAQPIPISEVRDGTLAQLDAVLDVWRRGGFAGLWPDVSSVDFLKGRPVSVSRVDGDDDPADGICGGILPDGALDVGGVAVYAGEAHVRRIL